MRVKHLPANSGDTGDSGSVLGSGRSPGGGKGNPLQYSCPENPMDRGAQRAASMELRRVRHDYLTTTTNQMYLVPSCNRTK